MDGVVISRTVYRIRGGVFAAVSKRVAVWVLPGGDLSQVEKVESKVCEVDQMKVLLEKYQYVDIITHNQLIIFL